MALPKAPDIPMPKPEDEDYMKVWHKCLQLDIENYQIKCECRTWRKAFYTMAIMLFAVVTALIVLTGSLLLRLWEN